MLVGEFIAVLAATARADRFPASGKRIEAGAGDGVGGCVEDDFLVGQEQRGRASVVAEQFVAIRVIGVRGSASRAGDGGELVGVGPGQTLRASGEGALDGVADRVVPVGAVAGAGRAGGAGRRQRVRLAGTRGGVGVCRGRVTAGGPGNSVIGFAGAVAERVEAPRAPVRAAIAIGSPTVPPLLPAGSALQESVAVHAWCRRSRVS